MADSDLAGFTRRKYRRTVLFFVLLGVSVLIFVIGLGAFILLDRGPYGANDFEDIISYVFVMLLLVNVVVGWALMLAATAMGGRHSHSNDHRRMCVLRNRLIRAIFLLIAIRILAIAALLIAIVLDPPLSVLMEWSDMDSLTQATMLAFSAIIVLYQAVVGPWVRTITNLHLASWVASSADPPEKSWRAVATRLMLHTFGLFMLIWVQAIIGLIFLTLTDPFGNTSVTWGVLSRFASLIQRSSSAKELLLWGSTLLLMTLHSIGQGIIIAGVRLLPARKQGKSSA